VEHVVHAGPGTAVAAKVAGMVHDAERLAAQAQFVNAVVQACLELRGPRSWWTTERISRKPFGLRSGLSRPCVVVEDLTGHSTMLGSDAPACRQAGRLGAKYLSLAPEASGQKLS
jgi:hypothetical protein